MNEAFLTLNATAYVPVRAVRENGSKVALKWQEKSLTGGKGRCQNPYKRTLSAMNYRT